MSVCTKSVVLCNYDFTELFWIKETLVHSKESVTFTNIFRTLWQRMAFVHSRKYVKPHWENLKVAMLQELLLSCHCHIMMLACWSTLGFMDVCFPPIEVWPILINFIVDTYIKTSITWEILNYELTEK